VKKLNVLATIIVLAAVACGGNVTTGSGGSGGGGGGTTTSSSTTSSTSTTTDTCSPDVYAEPGCGETPSDLVTIAAGCYEACTTVGMHCQNGGTCQKAWVNPCTCNGGNGPCCNTCSGEQLLCVE
jgi:hypothetical protein